MDQAGQIFFFFNLVTIIHNKLRIRTILPQIRAKLYLNNFEHNTKSTQTMQGELKI